MDQNKNLTDFKLNCTDLIANISGSSSSEILLKEAHITLAIGFWMTGLLCIAGKITSQIYKSVFINNVVTSNWIFNILYTYHNLNNLFHILSGMFANVLAFIVLSRPTNCVMFHLLRSLAFC